MTWAEITLIRIDNLLKLIKEDFLPTRDTNVFMQRVLGDDFGFYPLAESTYRTVFYPISDRYKPTTVYLTTVEYNDESKNSIVLKFPNTISKKTLLPFFIYFRYIIIGKFIFKTK